VEDVTHIILNLKETPIVLHADDPKILTLDVEGPALARAGDLTGDPAIEIFDPEAPIATVNEGGHLKFQALIGRGSGYVEAEKNFDETMGIGWIPIDSVHSPVSRVNYRVEAARLGRATDYERLVLEVWTNGTTSPGDAVSLASTLLREHLTIFVEKEAALESEPVLELSEELSGLQAVLSRRIDELDLSVRSANCLKNANIHTLQDLVMRSEKEMLETKNFGRKSLQEVQDILSKHGLHLGMDIPAATTGVVV
jgi:DNA-directed RNA polymerase subunit alpha